MKASRLRAHIEELRGVASEDLLTFLRRAVDEAVKQEEQSEFICEEHVCRG